MPQKGQITKHEWDSITLHLEQCPHCKVVRQLPASNIKGSKIIYRWVGNESYDEPPCITRKTQADEPRT